MVGNGIHINIVLTQLATYLVIQQRIYGRSSPSTLFTVQQLTIKINYMRYCSCQFYTPLNLGKLSYMRISAFLFFFLKKKICCTPFHWFCKGTGRSKGTTKEPSTVSFFPIPNVMAIKQEDHHIGLQGSNGV